MTEPAVRLERRLPHPVERVWRAVNEPSELAQWFVAPVERTPVGRRAIAQYHPELITDKQ
jgi:uncharacterized protein YndB with AHSA1/START domain